MTLQAQREYPADMQCKDKFLLQSTIVPPNTDVDELPADAVRILTWALFEWTYHFILISSIEILFSYFQFNKDSGRAIEECKLKVIYMTPNSAMGNPEDEKNSSQSSTVSAEVLLFVYFILILF